MAATQIQDMGLPVDGEMEPYEAPQIRCPGGEFTHALWSEWCVAGAYISLVDAISIVVGQDSPP